MKIRALSLFAPHNFRRFLYLSLALVILTSLAALLPCKMAVAAPGDRVSSFISATMAQKYGKYHDVPGLPLNFADYAQKANNQFYYATLDFHAIYCIEINRHSWYSKPDEFTTSSQFPGTNTEKQRMLAYTLAQGQRFFGEDENSVKRYTATQIAVWIIAEGHATDGTNLDPILSSASGTPPDDAAFAPTLEVGRLARQLLDGAKAFASSADDVSTLFDPIIPSFMSFSENTAQTFTMQNAGTYFQVDLADVNGVIGRDWPNLLKVVDSGGLTVLGFHDNTMSVRGDPKQATTIKLTGPYGGYEIRYLSTNLTTPAGEPFQNMAQLARLDSGIPLYFKVALDGSAAQLTSLGLKKTVSGSSDVTKEFKFTLHFKTASGTDASGILLNGADFKSGGTLTLKHGATAYFSNIPLGTTYEIIESDYSTDGYISDKANNTVKGTATTKEHIAVSYTNTYKNPDPKGAGGKGSGTTKLPKTGDTALMPSVALAAVLLALALTGFFVRRRSIERMRG